MMNVVGVQIRRAGPIYPCAADQFDLVVGDHVIVDIEKMGNQTGVVVSVTHVDPEHQDIQPLHMIVRKAHDFPPAPSSQRLAEIQTLTAGLIKDLGLNMRLLQVQGIGPKMIIYFTAPGRVDFRELVRILAQKSGTRIELKQVAAREETKLLGGLGICGREYCCSSFLRDFVPVSIKMAKNQNLALNPTKISGGCGRLLCCLSYENDTYTALRQNLPPKGTLVALKVNGRQGPVVKADLLNQAVTFQDTQTGEHIRAAFADLAILDDLTPKKTPSPEEAQATADAIAWIQKLDLPPLLKALNIPFPRR